MKKIFLLFIIIFLLSGCYSNSRKLNLKKEFKEKSIICLEEENCNFLNKDNQVKKPISLNKVITKNNDEIINDNIVNINNIEIRTIEEGMAEEGMAEEGLNDGYFTYLNFGEINFDNNTIEITFDSVSEIKGFQFYLSAGDDEILITNAFGGLSEEYGIDVMVGDGTNMVVAFSLEGNVIPVGTGVLTILSFDNIDSLNLEICISELIISGIGGNKLDTIDPVCSGDY